LHTSTPNIVRQYERSYSNVITPLVYRGVLYLIKNGGIITSLEPVTGKVLKTGRTREAIDEYFDSPVAADGEVFLLSHSGKMTVLRADPRWQVLSVNDLDETSQATPAILAGRIFIRTHRALWNFGLRDGAGPVGG